jgi:hypothetical protein
MWRASRYRTNLEHVRAYFKLAEITEPSEDQDDRHALYAMQVGFLTNFWHLAKANIELGAPICQLPYAGRKIKG